MVEASHSRYRGAASALLAAALVYMAAGVWYARRTPIVGLEFNEASLISRVYLGTPAEAAGFQLHDRIVKLDGKPVDRPWGGPHGYLSGTRVGEVKRFVVERGGQQVELVVTLGRPLARFVFLRLATSIVGLSFLLCGATLFLRHAHRVAGVFFLLCLAMGIQLMYPPSFPGMGAKLAFAMMQLAAAFTFCTMLLYLFLIFPRPSSLIENRSYLVKAVFTLALVAAFLLMLVVCLGQAVGLAIPKGLLTAVNLGTGGLLSGYVVLAIGAFLHRYVTTPRGPDRRSATVMLVGIVVGLVPGVAHEILSLIYPTLPSSPLTVLLLVVIPLTFSYAILRESRRLETG